MVQHARLQALLEQNITVDRRTCVADEHYVPTLLAMHGLDDEVALSSSVPGILHSTMRSGSITKVPAKCMQKYYSISNCIPAALDHVKSL